MQPPAISVAEVAAGVTRLWWPALRIAGFVLAAPVASEATIPKRVKVILTLSLAFLIAPLATVPMGLSVFSGAGALVAVQEVLIGVSIGMVMELAFDALTFAGQTVSMSMGLGFATLIDPQRGANVTVLGQIYMILGMLTYMAINGHLMLLGALANSFQTLPIGGHAIEGHFFLSVATWGGRIFETGLMVGLPAVIALAIVNMALGVVSRAAPQLNLFGIGFTIVLLSGFCVLILGLDGLMSGITRLIEQSLAAAVELTGPVAAGAR
jgi:flagellar biosynthetic protein FliR